MSDMEIFFKNNYKKIVNYCGWFQNYWDVEEVTVDVIMSDYEKLKEKGLSDSSMVGYMGKIIKSNLLTKYKLHSYSRTRNLDEIDYEYLVDSVNPEDIICLKQRLPEIDPILLEYQQHDGSEKTGSEKSRYSYAKTSFLEKLNGEKSHFKKQSNIHIEKLQVVIDLLKQKAMRPKDIAVELGLNPDTVKKYIQELKKEGKIFVFEWLVNERNKPVATYSSKTIEDLVAT